MLVIFLQALLISLFFFGVGLRIYKGKSKRWGGVVLVASFLILVLGHRELEMTKQLQGLLWGAVSILLFGLWDDNKNLSWFKQLLFQIFLVGLLVWFGFQVDFFRGPGEMIFRLDGVVWQGVFLGSVIFIFFWVVSIINAINWLDGIDSSLGVVSLWGGLSLVFVSLLPEVNQPAVAILAVIFLGTIGGFLLFNLPPAKVEAGTVGSYWVGFLLSALAIVAGSKIITLMIILVLPLLDFGWVIGLRLRKKQVIFLKDKNHLHHRLKKIGWDDRMIFLSYFVFLGVVLTAYSLVPSREVRMMILGGEIIFLSGFFIWVERKLLLKKVK
jgi:UDP-GlcNAc:undecaprenyl-phosphate GlcNAc-1-phosphate transferase